MPLNPPPQLTASYILFVVSFCGALILAAFALWLRRRGVKDSSLVWIGLSLFSWAVSHAVGMLSEDWLRRKVGIERTQIGYFLSPVSSLLFTKTAFRLARVRELFRHADMKIWPSAALAFVGVLSLIALFLIALPLILSQHTMINSAKIAGAGRTIDAIASCASLTILGAAMTYSFYKYGNLLLAGLTVITITSFNALQFIEAAKIMGEENLAALKLPVLVMMIMLFTALAVAWSLSDTSRLKTVGAPANINVIAMFFDLRGSTKWAAEALQGDLCYVGAFINELHTWAWKEATNLPCGRPNVIKFLGDGFMFVWEASRDQTPACQAARVAKLGCNLVQQYPSWAAQNPELWRGVPSALGVGVDVGPAMRLTFENGSEDYIGAPLNMAAKMQDLARPCGGVVVRADIWNGFDPELRAFFPTRGNASRIMSEQIIVYATEEVEMPVGAAAIFLGNQGLSTK